MMLGCMLPSPCRCSWCSFCEADREVRFGRGRMISPRVEAGEEGEEEEWWRRRGREERV